MKISSLFLLICYSTLVGFAQDMATPADTLRINEALARVAHMPDTSVVKELKTVLQSLEDAYVSTTQKATDSESMAAMFNSSKLAVDTVLHYYIKLAKEKSELIALKPQITIAREKISVDKVNEQLKAFNKSIKWVNRVEGKIFKKLYKKLKEHLENGESISLTKFLNDYLQGERKVLMAEHNGAIAKMELEQDNLIDELRTVRVELGKRLQEKEKAEEALSKTKKILHEAQDSVNLTSKKIQETKTKLNTLNKEIRDLKAERDSLKTEKADLEKEIAQLNAVVSEKVDTIKYQACVIAENSKQLDFLNKEVTSLNNDIKNLKAEKKTMRSNLQKLSEGRHWRNLGLFLLGALLFAATGFLIKSFQENKELLQANTKNVQLTNNVKAALRKQEQLNKNLALSNHEINHRVKNNLQTIASILRIQARRLEGKAKVEITEAERRVNAIGLLYRTIEQTDDKIGVNVAEYIRKLISTIQHIHRIGDYPPEIALNLSDLRIDSDMATPLGLIINELLTNVFKHAFKLNGVVPQIYVGFQPTDETEEFFRLDIRDNGSGLPEGFDIQETQSFGLKMVRLLVGELNGSLDFKNEKGAHFSIILKKPTKVRQRMRA